MSAFNQNAAGYNGMYGPGSIFRPDPVLELGKTRIIATYEQCGLLPKLAMTDFTGELRCGTSVQFMTEPEICLTGTEGVQNNEDPYLLNPRMPTTSEMKVCQQADFEMKFSERDIYHMCNKFDVWIGMLQKALDRAILNGRYGIESYVLQKTIAQVAKRNTGNLAGTSGINLGSNALPFALGGATQAVKAEQVRTLLRNLSLLAMENNWNCNNVDVQLVTDPATYSALTVAYDNLNQCCDGNIMFQGMYNLPMFGMNILVTNNMPTTVVSGVTQHYILAVDKNNLGYAHDLVQYKWWHGKRDRFLIGSWEYDSHLINPLGAAVATVTL